MRRSKKRLLIAFFLLPAFTTPQSAFSQVKEPKSLMWTKKMRELEQSLQEILVDVSSDERFNSSKNFGRIERSAEHLSKLANEINKQTENSPDRDPSIQIIAGLFSKAAKHAYSALRGGHREYARGLIKSLSAHCIACHTRSNAGPSFTTSLPDSSPLLRSLNALDKANYFTAVRQFDRALQEYEKILNDKSAAERRPFDWEKALRSGLAITVRVKQDPEKAQALVERVLETRSAPYYLKEQALVWKNTVEAWKKENLKHAQTEEGYYALAVRLLTEAKTLQQYPSDRSADILYLRASSAVHDQLSFAPDGIHSAEGLYLAGLSYEVLNDLNLWDMHEFYYLMCINRMPHTEIAKKCFRQYQQSVYHGYTGSGGTNIPDDVRSKLNYFEKLAKPASNGEKNNKLN